MLHAARHTPRSEEVAKALEKELMRAAQTYKPVPNNPLFDIGVRVSYMGGRYQAEVFPQQLEDYNESTADSFNSARDNTTDDVRGFLQAFGHDFLSFDQLRTQQEWVGALNVFFAANQQPPVTDSLLLSGRGHTHA